MNTFPQFGQSNRHAKRHLAKQSYEGRQAYELLFQSNQVAIFGFETCHVLVHNSIMSYILYTLKPLEFDEFWGSIRELLNASFKSNISYSSEE